MQLELQCNNLASIPPCILKLPSLCQLNLSSNELVDLPLVSEWSPSLTSLDLSHNRLTTIVGSPAAASLTSLNLANNRLCDIPSCIRGFTKLCSLDLRDNKLISRESLEGIRIYGNLTRCTEGNTDGQYDGDGTRNIPHQDVKIQDMGMEDDVEGTQVTKIVLLGESGTGKTTLASLLSGSEDKKGGTGLVISTWKLRQGLNNWGLHLNIWDVSGGDQGKVMCQCLLSEQCICILLFNLKKVTTWMEEMRIWVEHITAQAPGVCLILVGTHLDELSDQEGSTVQDFLREAAILPATNATLQAQECLAVGLKGTMQNVDALKEAIWRCAIRYPINNHHLTTMDQRLMTNHANLARLGEIIQNVAQNSTCKPVLCKEEFRDLICKSNLLAHEDEGMESVVGHFLCTAGFILHYNDPSHDLDDLYFVNPRFLCKTVMQTVRNSFITGGILHTRSFPALFGNNCLVTEYLEQYVMLLSRCNIALVVDNQELLIPSMLPNMQPVRTGTQGMSDKLMYTRHFVLDYPLRVFPGSLPNFWSQLLIRIMHFIPRVHSALENSPLPQAPLWTSGEPLLIPNVQGSLPCKPGHPNNATATWWRGGIVYHDSELEFQVELLHNTVQKIFEGVLIRASHNPHGAKVFGQLVKMVTCLFVSVPRHAVNNKEAMKVKQITSCYICAKLGHPSPYKFKVGKCFSAIATNKLYTNCKQDECHTVLLSELVPDLMLYDLDPGLVLSIGSLSFMPSEVILAKGRFSTVYRGQHKGTNVAIKQFHGTPRDAFTQLRKETTLLHNLRHPHVVPLIGALLHPVMALVVEEAPLGSLDKVVIKRRQAVHRLVLHRIATQVAAVLGYLHSNGILRCECRASDILVWSLDPGSLFHCKLGDFGMAKELDPIGVQLPQGAAEYIAPEALRVEDSLLLCDKRVDVYSYAMLLYQMIARREPLFTGISSEEIKQAVIKGERPELRDVPMAETSYFYLTRLMQRCWDGCPDQRPSTAEVVSLLCLSPMQSVMAVHPVETEHTIRSAHLTPPTKLGGAPHDSTLWMCCDGVSGVEIAAYEVRTMAKKEGYPISDQQLLHCSLLTAQHLWVCTSRRHGNGELHAFDIHSRKLNRQIALKGNSVYCLACSERMIYCGMHEGLCVAFDQESGVQCSSQKLSDYRIDGLALAPDLLWVSTLHRIFLLDLTTLEVRVTLTRPGQDSANVGQLKALLHEDTVWSANFFKSPCFTSWSKDRRMHNFDVDAKAHLSRIDHRSEENSVISALTPVLDTVWVAMVTGHIMVFHDKELLTWFRPYKEYIRFLTCLHCNDPYYTEKAMVVSGAKKFIPSMVAGLNCNKDMLSSSNLSVMLVMWEAFPAKQCRQMQFVSDNPTCFAADKAEMAVMINKGGFNDGILEQKKEDPTTALVRPEAVPVETPLDDSKSNINLSSSHSSQGLRVDTLSFSQSTCKKSLSSGEPSFLGSVCAVPFSSTTDLLDIRISRVDGERAHVICPMPIKLEVVLCKLAEWQQSNSDRLPQSIDAYVLSYYLVDTVQSVFIRTQLDLDRYLLQARRPPLLLTQRV